MKTFIELNDDCLDLKVQGKIIAKYNDERICGNTNITVLARITDKGKVYIDKYLIHRNKNLKRSAWVFLRNHRTMWSNQYPHISNIGRALELFPDFIN